MKQPVVAYRSLESSPYADFVSNQIGLVAKSPEEVIKALSRMLNAELDWEKVWTSGRSRLTERIASLSDGEHAYEKIVGELLTIKEWQETTYTVPPHHRLAAIKEFVKQSLKEHLPPLRNNGHYYNKFPTLTLRELKHDIGQLCRYAELPAPNNVVRTGHFTYAIY
jgi:hypothetical protein